MHKTMVECSVDEAYQFVSNLRIQRNVDEVRSFYPATSVAQSQDTEEKDRGMPDFVRDDFNVSFSAIVNNRAQ